MKERASSKKGIFGNYIPLVDGEVVLCLHFHRTASGAERCAKETIRFLEKVDQIKAKREKESASV